MSESLHIRSVEMPPDVDPATVCEVHAWPTDGLARRLVAAMRERHGKGGIYVCVACVERARASLPPREGP